MRQKTALAFMLIFLLLMASGLVADDQPQKKTLILIAVMDLTCGKNVDKDTCSPLTDIIIDELIKLDRYTVIDRANRDKKLSEAKAKISGCVDKNCAIEAGRILGVARIIFGSVDFMDKYYVTNLQIVNVKTSEIEASSMKLCECDFKGLTSALRNSTREIAGEPQVHRAGTNPNSMQPRQQ